MPASRRRALERAPKATRMNDGRGGKSPLTRFHASSCRRVRETGTAVYDSAPLRIEGGSDVRDEVTAMAFGTLSTQTVRNDDRDRLAALAAQQPAGKAL